MFHYSNIPTFQNFNIDMSNFKEQLRRVKAFVFDVDGVLSEQTMLLDTDGNLIRTSSIRDGFAK
jgi:3-deoxy-D-manno-octulosonate 8-phosphate phosphatase (KDO 8-P phosphatase)